MVQHKGVKDKVYVPKSADKLNRSNKDICEDYLRSPQDFQIYQENRLIFDSETIDRSNIVFYDDHFNLYGKHFTYKGIKITKKSFV